MDQTASAKIDGGFSAAQAVADVRRLEGLHGALQRRTAGITWMIWGLATTGMFVAYDFTGLLISNGVRAVGDFMPFMWAFWVALGTLATVAVWRSAGLVVPGLGNPRLGWLNFLLFFVVFTVGFGTYSALHLSWVEPAIMLALFGLTYLVMAATGLACTNRVERLLRLGVGLLLAGCAVGVSLAVHGTAAYVAMSMVGPLALAVGHFASGAWLSFTE